jgi:hypothetical protein
MQPRVCSKPGCRRPPKPDARYCKPCFANANRKSHHRHRAARNSRRRDRTDDRDQATRDGDSARAKLAVAIKRGTLKKHPCARCGAREDLTGFIADPKNWREVLWLCRDHHQTERERRVKNAKRAAWAELRARFAAEWPSLPTDVQARLSAEVEHLPAVITLRAARESPFYQQQLVAAFGRHLTTPGEPAAAPNG